MTTAIYPIIFALSTLSTMLIERRLIPFLTQKAKQPIYVEGPKWHLSKSGTPTMGGIALLITFTAILSLYSVILFINGNKSLAISILIPLLFSLGNGLIGVFDDTMKLLRRRNDGLTPIQKLLLQGLLAAIFLMSRRKFLYDSTIIDFSFGKVDLGPLYYPIAFIVILGIVNCSNLTDGIDGLCSSVAVIISTVVAFIFVSTVNEVGVIALALTGGCIGFLYFNVNPARIFMGDTGSLFIGSVIVSLFFSIKNPILAIPFSFVYVIEGISVIIQVAVYKMTKKRVFKMAPLHHHLEKCGISENRICVIAALATLISSLIAVTFMKL